MSFSESLNLWIPPIPSTPCAMPTSYSSRCPDEKVHTQRSLASKAGTDTSGADSLPSISDGDEDFYGGSDNAQAWSRLPKIMQAQPEGGYLDVDEPQMLYPNRLSTITERTEKTEAQSMYTKPDSTVNGQLSLPSRKRLLTQLPNRSIQVRRSSRLDEPIHRPEHYPAFPNRICNSTIIEI